MQGLHRFEGSALLNYISPSMFHTNGALREDQGHLVCSCWRMTLELTLCRWIHAFRDEVFEVKAWPSVKTLGLHMLSIMVTVVSGVRS
jgi:hypothetical protein